MLNRKLFFWLERLKISRGERRAIITLIIVLLVLVFINGVLEPRLPFDRSSYAQIEKVFKQRAALLKRKNKRVMAPFKGISASAIITDTIPANSASSLKKSININTAGIKELGQLPGIGPAYAQNIINFRNKKGSFTSKKQLLKVEGIGDARFAKIKLLITLGIAKDSVRILSTRSDTMQKSKIIPDKDKQTEVSKRINVNTADAKTLITLPGIGPAYAQGIIDYRRKNGSFTSFKELLKVKGIGKKRLENLIPFIKLTDETE